MWWNMFCSIYWYTKSENIFQAVKRDWAKGRAAAIVPSAPSLMDIVRCWVRVIVLTSKLKTVDIILTRNRASKGNCVTCPPKNMDARVFLGFWWWFLRIVGQQIPSIAYALQCVCTLRDGLQYWLASGNPQSGLRLQCASTRCPRNAVGTSALTSIFEEICSVRHAPHFTNRECATE